MKRFFNKSSLIISFLFIIFLLIIEPPIILMNNRMAHRTMAATNWNMSTDGELVITGGGSYYVIGSSTSDTIKIRTSSLVTITLDSVNIDVSDVDKCAFDSGNNVVLYIKGYNILKSAGQPGLKVENDDTLTIGNAASYDGSLVATGGGDAAGIGGDSGNDCGNIVIDSGNISAKGASRSAGIGGGLNGDGGNITINGGTINAQGGPGGSGIGGGEDRDGGLIVITGGSIKSAGTSDINGFATNGHNSVTLRVISGAVKSYNPAVVEYLIPITSAGYRYNYSYTGEGHGGGDTNLYFYLPEGEFTTTSLKSDQNPSANGETVTLTATITPSSATGRAEFFDGDISLGTEAFSGGKATLRVSDLGIGSHNIHVRYNSAEGFFGSVSKTVNHIVSKYAATLHLVYDRNSIKYGESITFTVLINPSEATGSILFYDGPKLFGISKISNGKASLTSDTLDAGILSVKAKYSGNQVFEGSTTAPVAITVIGASSPESALSGITPTRPTTPTGPASMLSSVASASNISISDESMADSIGTGSNESMPDESETPEQTNNFNTWVVIIFASLLIISLVAWFIVSRKRTILS